MRRVWVLSLVLLLVAAAAASGAPRVAPGWPAVAPSGPVFPGPGGGVVVIGDSTDRLGEYPYVATALRRDARVRWRHARAADCGNCEYGRTPLGLQPDGTYGPIGPFVSWAVARDGREVPSCPNVTSADGTCITTTGRLADDVISAPTWSVIAVRRGEELWRHDEPDLSWYPSGSNMPPLVVADAAGRVYASLGTRSSPGAPPRLISLDAGTGALAWRLDTALEVVRGLEDGVLASDSAAGEMVAIGSDGAERWRVAGSPWGALLDERRHRLYVAGPSGEGSGRGHGTVVAVDTRTGAVRWRTRGGESARVLSVTKDGVLLAAARKKRREVRAHAASGRLLWRYRTAVAVEGARELGDGTVVVATADDLLTRLDPRHSAPRVRRARISLGSRRFRTECADVCGVPPLSGTLLRIALPRPAVVKVRVLLPGRPPGDPWLQIAAPAGRTVTRILANRSLDRFRDGKRIRYRRATVEARWRDRGRTHVRRIPISVAPPPR